MIGYYVHWTYPCTAEDDLYYAGLDDEKLFYYEENADKYAKDYLEKLSNDYTRFWTLEQKDNEEGLTSEEQEEYKKLARICCGDTPDSYTIRKRDIKFEDEL